MTFSLAASIKASPLLLADEVFQFTKFEGLWVGMDRLIVKDSLSAVMIHFAGVEYGIWVTN